jgi:hypothetical protein
MMIQSPLFRGSQRSDEEANVRLEHAGYCLILTGTEGSGLIGYCPAGD